jgi:hypothetical protein
MLIGERAAFNTLSTSWRRPRGSFGDLTMLLIFPDIPDFRQVIGQIGAETRNEAD